MLLHLVVAGTRMPDWVNAGYRDYAERLQGTDYRMALTEIPLGKRRSGDDVTRAVAVEGERLLAAAGPKAYVVALQVHGECWSTARLARWLDERSREGDPLAFCILDPVVTVHPDQVMLEVFGKDESSYACLAFKRSAFSISSCPRMSPDPSPARLK